MFVVCDIGGSKTRVGVSSDGKTLDDIRRADTPTSYQAGVDFIVKSVGELLGEHLPEALVVGVPAILEDGSLTLKQVHNLPEWSNQPLGKDLSNALECPVYLENDTALVGLGELSETAYKDKGIAAYITVSTGVGGTRFIDGKVDRSRYGFEPGHQIIDLCSLRTLEESVSGTALTHLRGVSPREISADDPIWTTLARELAAGLTNTILHWSPEIVILGGPMMVGNPAIPLPAVKAALKEFLTIFPELPEITLSRLVDNGGLHGGLVYLERAFTR